MTDWRVRTVERVSAAVLWCARLVKGWLPRTLGGVASLSFIVWGAMGGNIWTSGVWWLVVGVVIAVLAFVAELVVQRPSYMKLSQLREDAERKALAKSEALERALRIMMIRLGKHCGLEGHSDRFSVYYFHDDEFVMVARHAKNPRFATAGRGRYPAEEGAIGAAWRAEQGQVLVNMPVSGDAWNRSARKQGLSEAAIAGMSMRSLGIAGYRLEAGEKSVGVLVVESTISNRVNPKHLDKISESHIVAAIGELVAAFALMTPAGESLVESKTPAPARPWKSVNPKTPFRVEKV